MITLIIAKLLILAIFVAALTTPSLRPSIANPSRNNGKRVAEGERVFTHHGKASA